MADYSKYSYRRLLEFFAVEDKYDKEGTDTAEYLLSMSKATSIKEMIGIYNNVFHKIAYYVYWRNSLPNTWFLTESWKDKSFLATELNECLNENIGRYYKGLDNPTKNDCYTCIANLRDSLNKTKVQNEILLYHKFDNLHGIDVIDNREKMVTIRRKIRELTPSTLNDYLGLLEQYVEVMAKLFSYGYKKSIIDNKFEEIRGINIKKEINSFYAKYKAAERIKKEENSFNIVIGIFTIIIIFGLVILVSEIGIIGIIIIIGLLGAVPKLFLTGKL